MFLRTQALGVETRVGEDGFALETRPRDRFTGDDLDALMLLQPIVASLDQRTAKRLRAQTDQWGSSAKTFTSLNTKPSRRLLNECPTVRVGLSIQNRAGRNSVNVEVDERRTHSNVSNSSGPNIRLETSRGTKSTCPSFTPLGTYPPLAAPPTPTTQEQKTHDARDALKAESSSCSQLLRQL